LDLADVLESELSDSDVNEGHQQRRTIAEEEISAISEDEKEKAAAEVESKAFCAVSGKRARVPKHDPDFVYL
jgi:hypothetical protein